MITQYKITLVDFTAQHFKARGIAFIGTGQTCLIKRFSILLPVYNELL